MKSGQASTEYALIVLVGLALILPAVFVFYQNAGESSEKIDQAQIEAFGTKLVQNAERVYALGPPTRIKFEEKLPPHVSGISVSEQDGLYVLKITTDTGTVTNEFAFPTEVPLAGDILPSQLSPGLKKITLAAAPVIAGKSLVTMNLKEDAACSDGTAQNQCSTATNPGAGKQIGLCFNNVLIENCLQCGCQEIITGTPILCKSDNTCRIPKISSVIPFTGSKDTIVTITGTDFLPGAAVKFGSASAAVTSIEENEITVVVPEKPSGSSIVDVTVTNPDGGFGTMAAGFTYVLSPHITSIYLTSDPLAALEGPATGGTSITITGLRFDPAITVKVGDNFATNVVVGFFGEGQSSLTATTPAGPEGQAVIKLTNPDGGTTSSSDYPTRVFTTQSSYNGNLIAAAQLIDPGFTGTGLEAADLLCRNEAGSGKWTAWLSSSSTAAKNRIADDKYMLASGTLIASNKAQLLNAESVPLKSPIIEDRNGEQFVTARQVWTGTYPNGLPTKYHCNNWQSGTGSYAAFYGNNFQSNAKWTYNFDPAADSYPDSCDKLKHLYCIENREEFTYAVIPSITQTIPATALELGGQSITIRGSSFADTPAVTFGGTPAAATFVDSTEITAVVPAGTGTVDLTVTNPNGKSATAAFTYNKHRIFVTSQAFSGDLITEAAAFGYSGTNPLAAADKICQGLADNAQLSSRWAAWLSDSEADAKDRVLDVEYTQLPGAPVAASKAALLNTIAVSLENPINIDETGNPTTDFVWTGTFHTGSADTTVCGDWASLALTGTTGYSFNENPAWTDAADAACSADKRIYCAERSQSISTPTITAVNPANVQQSGGEEITITGTGFVNEPTVKIGGVQLDPAAVTFVSSTKLTAITPPHAGGQVDVVARNPDSGYAKLAEGLNYIILPAISSISPGGGYLYEATPVTITGTGFSSPTVKFRHPNGATASGTVNDYSSTQIHATTPRWIDETKSKQIQQATFQADVIITNADTGQAILENGFTFQYNKQVCEQVFGVGSCP